MVVVDILGVIKLVPVAKDEPPVLAAYQLIVPAEAVALKTIVPVPHLLLLTVVIIGSETTVTVTCRLGVVTPDAVASIKKFVVEVKTGVVKTASSEILETSIV